jgi:hypothetical protein
MADQGGWTVARYLEGKPPEIVELYECFIGLVERWGPFTYSVTKTAITLKGERRGFAGLAPKAASLDGYLDLQRQVFDPRIRRSSPYTKRLYVHQFRVTSRDQLDETFAGWLDEAYQVGQGAHLT